MNYKELKKTKIELETETRCKPTFSPTYDNTPIVYDPIIPSFEVKEILAYYYQIRNNPKLLSSYYFSTTDL